MAIEPNKIGQAGLNMLLLSGPVLGVATKGFAPLLALSGMLAILAMLVQPASLIEIHWKSAAPALPFFIFLGLSLFWTRADNGADLFSYLFWLLFLLSVSVLYFLKRLKNGKKNTETGSVFHSFLAY